MYENLEQTNPLNKSNQISHFLLNALLRSPVCRQGMVPHIIPIKEKMGHKEKTDIMNVVKGIVACHANSVRRDEAEEHVISLIKNFTQSDGQIGKKILGIKQNTKQHEDAYLQGMYELNNRITE
ncbi:hypothetical protein PZB78_18070 [Bacillus halotolerans]|uniref:hypothetical protein n=1 Tax=Bacillus halotolerans TaxID=260554 RepID=UPI002570734F|nr:hypothetical protein [Bacillus halotolerans]WJE43102.1 hypothetical protein QRD86_21225 [Bacillus halotolerans]